MSILLDFSQLPGQHPKTRLTQREKVQQEVQAILQERDVEGLLAVEIVEHDKEDYKQATRGRPGKNTKYVKTVKNGVLTR